METVTFDYARLRLPAVADMSDTLREVSGPQWEAPSLCDGWQVRHIPAHLATGYLFSPEQVAAAANQLGSVAEAARLGAIEFASAREAEEVVEAFERHAGQPEVTGVCTVIPPPDLFVDQVIHRLDVAVPLGMPVQIREEHLVAALTAMPEIEGLIGSKQRASGLRLEATDVAWTWGDGPLVRGPGDALLLALSGRPAGLERCEGAGVELLRAKQGPDGRR